MSAVETAAAIRSKRISPIEAVRSALSRIEDRADLNAFITVCADRALLEGREAENAVLRGEEIGSLHGVPFSVKDLTDTEGVATTYGSAAFAGVVPSADAVAVARARAEGAILIGKTTTPEFGHKALTEGPFFGRTLNPWNAKFTCGGSSGGAAVAVASGMGPIALGTDGGGSVRIPASCCGVVGFKATLGQIPNLQAPDLFGASSYVGPIGRNVADTRLFFEAIRGPDRRDPYGQHSAIPQSGRSSLQELRIAWLPRCGNRVDPEVEKSTAGAISLAQNLGAAVETIELDFVSLEKHFLVILRSALRARLQAQIDRTPELFDPALRAIVEAAKDIDARTLWQAQFARTACFQRVQEVFESFDLIASPTLSAPPLPVGTDPIGEIEIAGRPAGTIRGAWYPYTFPFNLTGHPAATLPCGLTSGGLPMGLQLVGRWNEDITVLGAAAEFEAALAFDGRAVLEGTLSERTT